MSSISAALEAYIRQAAAAHGIDPDVAITVAKHEGGLSDPFRHGAGPAPRSQAPGLGPTENSYGPFQLYVSGTGAGLGDRALRAGIDPRKDWQGGINFALDEVARKGWGQWYGAKAAGITGMRGVSGHRGPAAAVLHPEIDPTPPAEAPIQVADAPVAAVGATPIIPNPQNGDNGGGSAFGRLFSAMAPAAGSFQPVGGGPAVQTDGGFGATIAAQQGAEKARQLALGLAPDVDALLSLAPKKRVAAALG